MKKLINYFTQPETRIFSWLWLVFIVCLLLMASSCSTANSARYTCPAFSTVDTTSADVLVYNVKIKCE